MHTGPDAQGPLAVASEKPTFFWVQHGTAIALVESASISSLERVLIGVDVGCTTTSAALVTADGTILSAVQMPTGLGLGTAVDTVLAMVGDLCAEAHARGLTVEGVGLGLPGLVDVDRGMLKGSACAYLADFHGVPLAERISAKTGVQAIVDNDVNALALAEWMFGHARGSQSCVVLAVGSGVGAGIIFDGSLVRGRNGYAGEFGHVPIHFDGPRCVCGGRGCLYVYVGGNALAGEAQDRVTREPSGLLSIAGGDTKAITAETIFKAATAGDPMSQAMVERACGALGAGLAVIVNGLNPEVVIVTGGVVNSLAPLQGDILRRTGDYALAETLAATRIVFVSGDKRQTARGGAALFLYERARHGSHRGAGSPQTTEASTTPMIHSDRG